MLKRQYTYTVLRYVHDPLTAEFVNVGLVLFCPATGAQPAVLKSGARNTIGRMRDMFPDMERADFTSAVRTINKMLGRLSEQLGQQSLFPSDGDAATLAQRVLPRDDSSFQWSAVGSGVTDSPDKAFDRLFARMVTRYDVRGAQRRSDDEVWRPVRLELEQRQLPIDLEPKVIVGDDDKIEFQHAWKNGAWHVYEPLSLDLADADGIYRKAHRWLGQLTSVASGATEPFNPYFIVGAPSDPALDGAYRRALKILKKSPGNVQVFEEADVSALVDRIEDDMRAHPPAGN